MDYDQLANELFSLAAEAPEGVRAGPARPGAAVSWDDLTKGQQARVEAIRANPSIALAVWAGEMFGRETGVPFANVLRSASKEGLVALGRLLVGMGDLASTPRKALSEYPSGYDSMDVSVAMGVAARSKPLPSIATLSLQDMAISGAISLVNVEYEEFEPNLTVTGGLDTYDVKLGRAVRKPDAPRDTKIKTLTTVQAKFLPHTSIWAKINPVNWTGGFIPSALPPVLKHTSLGKLGDVKGGPLPEVAGRVMRLISMALKGMPAGKHTGGAELLADIMAECADEAALKAIDSLIKTVCPALPPRPNFGAFDERAITETFISNVRKTKSQGALYDPLKRFTTVVTEARDSRSSVDEAGKSQCGWTSSGEIHNGLSITEKQHRAMAAAKPFLRSIKDTPLWIVGAGKRAHVVTAAEQFEWRDITILDIEPSVAASRKYKAISQDFMDLASLPSETYVFSDAYAPIQQATKKGTGGENSPFTRSWKFAVKCSKLEVEVFTCKLFLPDTIDYDAHKEVYDTIFRWYDLVSVSHGARIHSGETYCTFARRKEVNAKPEASFARFVIGRLPQAEWAIYANIVRNTFASLALAPPSYLFSGALEACFDKHANCVLESYFLTGKQPGDYAGEEEPGYDPAEAIAALVLPESVTLTRMAAKRLVESQVPLGEGVKVVEVDPAFETKSSDDEVDEQ